MVVGVADGVAECADACGVFDASLAFDTAGDVDGEWSACADGVADVVGVEAAGDENVGWGQWWCRLPGGSVPGWSLYTVRDGKFTLDHDVFDTNAARAANS